MRTEDFDYALPPGRIAAYPAAVRDGSRLLVLHAGGRLADASFAELPQLLPPRALLVFNDTRVRPARLRLPPADGSGELFLVRPLPEGTWLCLGKPGRKLKPGRVLQWAGGPSGTIVAVRPTGEREVRFDGDIAAYAERCGEMPLPPYLKREEEPSDRERYQTVYARVTGAVAAPTAGLHFTPALIKALGAAGHDCTLVTLHTGLGTFRPLQEGEVAGQRLEAEWYEVTPAAAEAVNAARRASRPIIAVGTTAVRTLETVAADDGTVRAGTGWTDIFIHPPRKLRAVDGMVTNFHLPRSSLLMLVSALAGREHILAAYRHAVDAEYRFYSYGDAMLILPEARNDAM